MDLPLWSVDSKQRPPPLWLVSNGWRTVGPVRTPAIARCAARGELPDEGWARIATKRVWRDLGDVREVRAARAPRDDAAARVASLEALLRLADEEDDALRLALRLAAAKLGADSGLVHAFGRDDHAPVTRFGLEPTAARLGERLGHGDVLAHVARIQRIALGDVDTHRAFRPAAERLGGDDAEIRGVAMLPIVGPRGPIAMIELGRSGRPFRSADADVLRQVGRLAATRLQTSPR